MRRSFEATVSALGYSIIESRCAPAHDGAFPHNDAVRFVLAQWARMPDWQRLPFACLTLAFDLCGLLRSGARFHRQTPAARAQQMERWRHSRISLCRDFIRFYDSLVILWWYSQNHVRSDESMDRLDDAPAEHAATR